MSKSKTRFVCQNCGAVSLKWQGQCSDCGEWNTLVEEVVETAPKKGIGIKNDLTADEIEKKTH